MRYTADDIRQAAKIVRELQGGTEGTNETYFRLIDEADKVARTELELKLCKIYDDAVTSVTDTDFIRYEQGNLLQKRAMRAGVRAIAEHFAGK